jgi:hypothetical protein
VGLEWTHAEFFGQGEGFAVVGLSLLGLRRLALRRNLTEKTQGIRLVATFLMFTSECQRTIGERVRLLQSASQQMRLSKKETTGRLHDDYFHCTRLCHRLCKQRQGLGDAPAQSIRRT